MTQFSYFHTGWSIKKRLIILISGNRNLFLFRWLDVWAKKYHEIYENSNFWVDFNGEYRVISKLNREKTKTVFDVGANVGYYAKLLKRSYPNADIHCFEVMQDTFKQLKNRMNGEEKVHINNFGLSDKKETVSFNYYPDAHWLTTQYENVTGSDEQSIQVQAYLQRGDRYCKEKKIQTIDFLKIDVEGSELQVIRGFENILSHGDIAVIQFEYGKTNIYGGSILKDFYDFLEPKGYVLGKVYPNYVDFSPYHVNKEDFIGPNYLAVHKSKNELLESLKNPSKFNHKKEFARGIEVYSIQYETRILIHIFFLLSSLKFSTIALLCLKILTKIKEKIL